MRSRHGGNPALAELLRAPRLIPWRNWSRKAGCLLAREAPKDLDELVRIIRQASGRIRPVGSGHSFSALVPTDGTLLSLAYFSGLLSHDSATLQAEFGGGTPMSQMGAPLKEIGQALVNMADIDYQTLAGAIATYPWHRGRLRFLFRPGSRSATGHRERRGARVRRQAQRGGVRCRAGLAGGAGRRDPGAPAEPRGLPPA
ncbi:FAD-binding protein [Pseudomonas aeruginosa]